MIGTWLGLVRILLLAICVSSTSYIQTFETAVLSLPTGATTQSPLDITISFVTSRDIYPTEFIGVKLPRFTKRLSENSTVTPFTNITVSSLLVSPSYLYDVTWLEYSNIFGRTGDGILPFRRSMLLIKSAINATIQSFSTVTLLIHKENDIGAVCGFAGSVLSPSTVVKPSDDFEIFTMHTEDVSILLYNATNDKDEYEIFEVTYKNNNTKKFTTYPSLGNGCSQVGNCGTTNGACDYCFEQCRCYDGFGSPTDIIAVGSAISPRCTDRVCPAGKAIGDIPTGVNKAHDLAECSNQGLCDRSTGVCKCFAPFGGSACERLACPNSCSGRGQCISMSDLAFQQRQAKIRDVDFEYGTALAMKSSAWDYQTMYSCVCDSTWPVGFNSGERQLAEYFGPDCSLKHCPSGNDPFTTLDEEDCHGLTQYPGVIYQVGMKGNRCHVDCSNRGICDYSTGRCKCFEGSWGVACDLLTNTGSGRAGSIAAANGTFIPTIDGN